MDDKSNGLCDTPISKEGQQSNAGPMLDRRLRRRTNIKTALVERVAFVITFTVRSFRGDTRQHGTFTGYWLN